MISVEAFFTRHGRDFTAGQVKRVARDYAAPLAIYTHGEIMMTASREQNERSLGAFHATMVARGLKRSVPRVVAIGLPRKGRMSVRVDWRHEDSAGDLTATSEVLYYCARGKDGALQIEIVEFLTAPFADIATAIPASAHTF